MDLLVVPCVCSGEGMGCLIGRTDSSVLTMSVRAQPTVCSPVAVCLSLSFVAGSELILFLKEMSDPRGLGGHSKLSVTGQ